MPINKEQVDRLLRYMPEPDIKVKGADIEWLCNEIYADTGIHYDPLTIPRPWQLEALAFACRVPRSLMFAKMRMGKTKLVLDWIDHLKLAGRLTKKALIVVPRPILLDVWKEQAATHSRLKVATVRLKAEDLKAALHSDADLIVISWSALQAIFTYKAVSDKRRSKVLRPDQENLVDFSRNFDLLSIDEIHLCKNPKSLRFEMAAYLARAVKYFMGLTGTPHGRNPFDLWPQAYLVDQGRLFGSSFWFFQNAFGKIVDAKWSNRTLLVYDRTKTDIIERKLASISLSYGWEGNIETREPLRNIVALHMCAEQRKLYNELVDKAITIDAREDKEAENIFVRLRQVSSGYLPFTNADGSEFTYRIPKSAKMEWIEGLLDELPEDIPMIFLYQFDYTGQMLCDLLAKRDIPHTWLWGKSKDKEGAVRDFRSGKVNVIVMNCASGDVGIDLSRADYMCFVEGPVSPTVRAQVEARPQSAAKRPLIIDDLVCSPVERKILLYVKEGKALLAKTVFNDGITRT